MGIQIMGLPRHLPVPAVDGPAPADLTCPKVITAASGENGFCATPAPEWVKTVTLQVEARP